MTAVFKREFKGYFSSPLGYIFLAVMFFFFRAVFFDPAGAELCTD